MSDKFLKTGNSQPESRVYYNEMPSSTSNFASRPHHLKQSQTREFNFIEKSMPNEFDAMSNEIHTRPRSIINFKPTNPFFSNQNNQFDRTSKPTDFTSNFNNNILNPVNLNNNKNDLMRQNSLGNRVEETRNNLTVDELLSKVMNDVLNDFESLKS